MELLNKVVSDFTTFLRVSLLNNKTRYSCIGNDGHFLRHQIKTKVNFQKKWRENKTFKPLFFYQSQDSIIQLIQVQFNSDLV